MRTLIITVTILSCSFLPVASSPPAPTRPLSLNISAPQKSFKSNSRIWINATITNTTDRDVGISETDPECLFLTEVRNSSGKVVSDTPHKKALNCDRRSTAMNVMLILKPNESRTQEVSLNTIIEMAQPDSYRVQLALKLANESTGIVKSNVITVTVTK